jgi:hypothetical protein
VPTRDYPNDFGLAPAKETIWHNNYLTEGKIGKLRNKSTRLRILREASEYLLSPIAELGGGLRIILMDIGHRLQKLDAS